MKIKADLSDRAEEALDELLRIEDNDALAEWAIENLGVTAEDEASDRAQERYEEGREDGFYAATANLADAENPKYFVLAKGYIGRIAWAVCERGDGRVLLLGGQEVPIDTRPEAEAAGALAHALSIASRHVKNKLDLAELQRRVHAEGGDGA